MTSKRATPCSSRIFVPEPQRRPFGFCGLLGLALALPLASTGCNEEEPEVVEPPPPPAAKPPQANAPDRLPPGVLMEGPEDAFGLAIPKKMKIQAAFPENVHAVGSVDAGELSNYVRKRVLVAHVEVADKRFIFPKVKIRGGDENKLYRIEVLDQGHETKLIVRDITPAPKVEGLTEPERWERAGMKPSGGLIDPNEME